MRKELRIKKSSDFEKVIKMKHSVVNRSFVIYFKENEYEHMRVGISVSKKMGKAHVRNKIKRQVRMMVNHLFNEESSYDYVIIVRKGYIFQSFEDNEKLLQDLLNKIEKKG